MNAVPKRFSSLEINNYKTYHCPISGVAAYSNNASTRWVNCPMVNDRPICYGLCLDLQSIARDDEFEYVEDFYELSKKLKIDVAKLRKICLSHQREILLRMISDESYPEDREPAKKLLDWIIKVEQMCS